MSKQKAQKQAEKKNAAKKVTKESLAKALAAKAETKTEEKKVLAKAKTERAERHTVATFMKHHIMEGKLSDRAIYDLTIKEFPDWQGQDREYYVAWYRWDLKRKGLGDFPAVEKISRRAAKTAQSVSTVSVKKGKFTHRVAVPEGHTVPKTKEPLEGDAAAAFLASIPKPTVAKQHRAHA